MTLDYENHPIIVNIPELGIKAITITIGEDGAPVVFIDTEEESDAHDRIRIHLNDAEAVGWR